MNLTIYRAGSLIMHPQNQRSVQRSQVQAGEVFISMLGNEDSVIVIVKQCAFDGLDDATQQALLGAAAVRGREVRMLELWKAKTGAAGQTIITQYRGG